MLAKKDAMETGDGVHCDAEGIKLPTLALCTEIERLCAVEQQTESLLCRYLAELSDRFERWDHNLHGFKNIYEFARIRFGMEQRLVRERVRVGRAVRELPQIGAAFAEGKVGYTQVREVTRVAEPTSDGHWLQEACRLPLRTLEARVADDRRRRNVDAPKPTAPPQDKLWVDLHLKLSPAAWAALQQAVAVTRQKLGKAVSVAEAIEVLAKDALASVGRTVRAGGAVRIPSATVTESRAPDGGAERKKEEPPATDTQPLARGDVSAGSPPVETRTPGGHSLRPEVAAELEPDAIKIFDIMVTRDGWNAGELMKLTGLNYTDVACAMVQLELARLIEDHHTGFRVTNPPGFC